MNQLVQQIITARPWLPAGLPCSSGFTTHATGSGPGADIGRARRVQRAYRNATADVPRDRAGPDIWTAFADAHHQDFKRLLLEGDPAELAGYLRALPQQGGGHGYFQGRQAFELLQRDAEERHWRALWFLDALVGLAESAGVLSQRCPEQGDFESPPAGVTALSLRTDIEAGLGCPITLPPVFDGLFALEPDAAAMHVRTIHGAHAVSWVSRFLAQLGGVAVSDQRIAEIGAGIGYTAYVGACLGVARYCVFDLPEVNAAQAFFLLATLGDDEVSLYGEDGATGRVRVMPAFAFDAEPPTLDAVLNVDSLPELAAEEAERYLARSLTSASWFFSINQEAGAPRAAAEPQSVVRRLVAAHAGYRAVQRVPSWVRRGYVEEIWRCERSPSGRAAV